MQTQRILKFFYFKKFLKSVAIGEIRWDLFSTVVFGKSPPAVSPLLAREGTSLAPLRAVSIARSLDVHKTQKKNDVDREILLKMHYIAMPGLPNGGTAGWVFLS